MSNEDFPDIKMPSILALFAWAIVSVVVIMTTVQLLGLPAWVGWIFCGASGWYARRICLWISDKWDACIIQLNQWAKEDKEDK